jgi:hypothetical protein
LLVGFAGWVEICVCGRLGCGCWDLLAAVVQLGGFEAGTVLSLIPLWGVGGIAMQWSSRLSVSPVIGDLRV